jgi:hypothetical protein
VFCWDSEADVAPRRSEPGGGGGGGGPPADPPLKGRGGGGGGGVAVAMGGGGGGGGGATGPGCAPIAEDDDEDVEEFVAALPGKGDGECSEDGEQGLEAGPVDRLCGRCGLVARPLGPLRASCRASMRREVAVTSLVTSAGDSCTVALWTSCSTASHMAVVRVGLSSPPPPPPSTPPPPPPPPVVVAGSILSRCCSTVRNCNSCGVSVTCTQAG